jgi:protein SCO1/2
MTAQTGQPFGSEDISGKIAVIYFGFTSCKSICPVTNTHMSTLYQAFPGNENLRFVFISVDPARDSLEVLGSFATRYGVKDHRWVFLRAPLDTVAHFCEKGLMLPADELPGGHTRPLHANRPAGRIRGIMTDGDRLGQDTPRSYRPSSSGGIHERSALADGECLP